jgi:hypothetical protein
MLHELIDVFISPCGSWRRHTRLRASVLEFSASLAEAKLHVKHPISAALRLLAAKDFVDYEALLDRYVHLLITQFKTEANKEVLTTSGPSIAETLISASQTDAAASTIDELRQRRQTV